jgi:hypothetical protein
MSHGIGTTPLVRSLHETSGPSGQKVLLQVLRNRLHLSDWHAFDPNDRNTYPKVVAPVQVRFEDGELA